MSNAGKSASCAPSAIFSRSRNTAIVASESCTLTGYDVTDIAFARQRKLSQQFRWGLFRADPQSATAPKFFASRQARRERKAAVSDSGSSSCIAASFAACMIGYGGPRAAYDAWVGRISMLRVDLR